MGGTGGGVPVAVKCLLDHGREDLWAETSFANEIRPPPASTTPAS